tara:strand:+ start:1265 stop:1606 length:342 start_codon:yes stop_codon:yes gene_type:complete
MSKNKGAYYHTVERANERYDIDDFCTLDIFGLKEAVLNNKAVCLSRNRSRGMYLVRYRDIVWKLIFDHDVDKVITVLPPNATIHHKKKRRGKQLSKNQLRKRGTRAFRALSGI